MQAEQKSCDGTDSNMTYRTNVMQTHSACMTLKSELLDAEKWAA